MMIALYIALTSSIGASGKRNMLTASLTLSQLERYFKSLYESVVDQ